MSIIKNISSIKSGHDIMTTVFKEFVQPEDIARMALFYLLTIANLLRHRFLG